MQILEDAPQAQPKRQQPLKAILKSPAGALASPDNGPASPTSPGGDTPADAESADDANDASRMELYTQKPATSESVRANH